MLNYWKEDKLMAIKIENRCVNCNYSGLQCIGTSCPNRNVEVCYCDSCGEEISFDETYCCDGMDVCEDCLKDMCKKEW